MSEYDATVTPFETTITVIVNAAVCDQTGLTWDPVSIVTGHVNLEEGPATFTYNPWTPNAASKLASPEIRGCMSFDETYTLAAQKQGLNFLPPDFMAFDASTGILTFTPTLIYHQGVYNIEVIQTPVYGSAETWLAFEVTVGCVIGSIVTEGPPSTQTIELYADPTFIDLTSWTYTQSPDCGFTVDHSFAWTGTGGAPIQSISTTGAQQLVV